MYDRRNPDTGFGGRKECDVGEDILVNGRWTSTKGLYQDEGPEEWVYRLKDELWRRSNRQITHEF